MVDNYPWLKSYPQEIDWNHPIDIKPLYSILEESAKRFPENTAIDFLGKNYSYTELNDLVNSAAEGFKKLGVVKGTKVGLFLPNCPQFIISYFAVLKAGGVIVNFSPLYSVPELKHQLEDSETEIMVTLNLKVLYPKVKDLLGYGKLKTIVVGTMQEVLSFPKNILFGLLKSGEIEKVKKDDKHAFWSEIINNDSITDHPKINPEKDPAVLQYTGGTTGVSKGAVLTHQNLYANTLQCGLWFAGLEEGKERMLGVLPFFHVFAMTVVMNLSLLKAAKIIIHPRFELVKVLKDIVKKKPTLMPGVPTMFNAINNHHAINKYDLSSLKACLSGGAPLPLDVQQKFEKMTGCKLVEGYGLTESSPVACANPIFGKNKEGSIGIPLPGTIVEIEDKDDRGKFLDIGKIGEICITGPQVMQGYWKRKSETEEVLIGERLRTGDMGYIDEDGYVHIVDRLKELIISGGFNIYPRDVEEAIYQHEAVLEAAVVGIDDQYKGQAVKAYVALKEGEDLTEKDLKDFLKERLAKYKMPKKIEFRDELPKTMIGKISKKDL